MHILKYRHRLGKEIATIVNSNNMNYSIYKKIDDQQSSH